MDVVGSGAAVAAAVASGGTLTVGDGCCEPPSDDRGGGGLPGSGLVLLQAKVIDADTVITNAWFSRVMGAFYAKQPTATSRAIVNAL